MYSIGFEVWKERWVSRRWKPTVMPTAVSRYMTAAIARSAGLTRLFQSRTIAAIVAAKGTTTAPRLAAFSSSGHLAHRLARVTRELWRDMN